MEPNLLVCFQIRRGLSHVPLLNLVVPEQNCSGLVQPKLQLLLDLYSLDPERYLKASCWPRVQSCISIVLSKGVRIAAASDTSTI